MGVLAVLIRMGVVPHGVRALGDSASMYRYPLHRRALRTR